MPTIENTTALPSASPDTSVPVVWKRILLVAFFLSLLPVIGSSAKFHGDERFYTDAALLMNQSGDYWTPFYPDGRIRLLKPILTYWAVAGTFELFGVSLFTARLLFALAGTLVVAITYRLAKTVFRSERTAFLAALILASNIELLTVSSRSTPDVLLCLFVLLSMWGFARIWFGGDRTLIAPLLAWGGMGLAVQTKGLLGLCPLAANALFWLLARPRDLPLRNLFRWPALLTGIALGTFWYVVMLQRHGFGAMEDFYADQVGSRVSRSFGFVLTNFSVYLFAGFRHFLPWSLLALGALIWGRKAIAKFFKEHRRECLFLVCLFVLLVVIFGLGNIRRARYLTASYPMLAILFAGMISAIADSSAFQIRFGRSVRFAAMGIALLGVAAVVLTVTADFRLVVGGGGLLAFGLAGLFATRKRPWAGQSWVAGITVLGFLLMGAFLRPVFSPSPMAMIRPALQQTGLNRGTIHTWHLTASEAGRIRLLTHGRYTVQSLDTNAAPDQWKAPVIVTVSPHHDLLKAAGYEAAQLDPTKPSLQRSWLGKFAEENERSGGKGKREFWFATRPGK